MTNQEILEYDKFKKYNHYKLVRDTHRRNPEIDLEIIKKIVTTIENLIMWSEKSNFGHGPGYWNSIFNI